MALTSGGKVYPLCSPSAVTSSPTLSALQDFWRGTLAVSGFGGPPMPMMLKVPRLKNTMTAVAAVGQGQT